MMHIPNRILNSATGIPEATFAQIKAGYPLVTAPGTGGEECMKRCGLNFTSVSLLTQLFSQLVIEVFSVSSRSAGWTNRRIFMTTRYCCSLYALP